MGHNTLAVLPKSRYWQDVAELVAGEGTSEEIVAASAKAAERNMLAAADDPVFVETVRLLLCIPLAARSEDFGQALRDQGIPVRHRPELLDLVAATSERLDTIQKSVGGKTDFGELSCRALMRALSTSIGDALPGLFGATPDDVQAAAKRLSWSKGIAELTRSYFGHLVSETLSYWLDRTIAPNVGADHHFASISERNAFDVELLQFSREATRIIQEFSGGWYGKRVARIGNFSSRDAAEFGAVSLKKIVDELRVREVRGV